MNTRKGMMILMGLGISALLAVSGCDHNISEPDGRLNIDELYQSWTHAYEEDQPGASVQVYRPTASKVFPPSRFRMQYNFYSDGTCEWLFLHPADRHHLKPARWEMPGDRRVLVLSDSTGKVIEQVVIFELKANLLRIERSR